MFYFINNTVPLGSTTQNRPSPKPTNSSFINVKCGFRGQCRKMKNIAHLHSFPL